MNAEKFLKDALDLLRASRQPDAEVQKNVYRKFETLRTNSEFNQCLAYIFSNPKAIDLVTRRQAGILLMRNLANGRVYSQMAAGVKKQVRDSILRCIDDKNRQIRITFGNILATIAKLEKGNGPWLGFLAKNLANPNLLIQDSTMIVVESLMEDCGEELLKAHPQELQMLMQKVVEKMKSNNEEIRHMAISAVGQAIGPGMPSPFQGLTEQYLQNLFVLAKDSSPKVLLRVGWAFIALQEAGSSQLKMRFEDCIKVMLHLASKSDEKVVFCAFEFFRLLLQHGNLPRSDWFATREKSMAQGALAKMLGPYLKNLVPLLLRSLVFSEEELADLGEEKDSHVPDTAQEVAPRHARQSKGKFSSKVDAVSRGEDGCEWSVRKSSANSLDSLAMLVQGKDLLPIFLPLVNQLLKHKQWLRRESGVLALGAVAGGCASGIKEHLESLFALLIKGSNDERSAIRRITCWTLSRYAPVLLQSDEDNKFLRPLVKTLLEKMGDCSKKVQKAACSAMLRVFEETAARHGARKVALFLEPVLMKVGKCMGSYQEANRHMLYDLIGTIARTAGPKFREQHKFLEGAVSSMLQHWSKMETGSYGLFPLLESLSAIALSAEQKFLPYAKVIFPQCLKLIMMNLKTLQELRWRQKQVEAKQQQKRQQQRDSELHSDSRFQRFEGTDSVVCCIELAGCIYRALGKVETHLAEPKAVFETLIACCSDPNPFIRQSAMAWMGDVVCASPGFIGGYFRDIARVIVLNLDSAHPFVCSNAAWALGEAAIRLGPRCMAPFTDAAMRKMIPILNNSSDGGEKQSQLQRDSGLFHSIALTISRLGLVCPGETGKHLEHFAKAWCESLTKTAQNEHPREVEMAFRGLCGVVPKRPQAMRSAPIFVALCEALASFKPPSQELHSMVKSLLHNFRAMFGSRWGEYFGKCSPQLRYHLARTYELPEK